MSRQVYKNQMSLQLLPKKPKSDVNDADLF